jgi:flagellin-like protein
MKFLLKQKKRSAVSPVIATLLLIAIAVAAAIIVYAFVTGLIGGLSNGAQSNLVTATGSLTIPSGSASAANPALLVVTIQNTANNPVTGIQVTFTSFKDNTAFALTCMGETTAAFGCPPAGTLVPATQCGVATDLSATQSVVFCNSTPAIVSAGAPLQVGAQVSASENVIGSGAVILQSGASYSMTVTVDFANGGIHSQALSVTAQI